jgi:hypothetical protein
MVAFCNGYVILRGNVGERGNSMKLHRFHLAVCVVSVVAIAVALRPARAEIKVQKSITAEEAKDHAQETNTVCGLVAGTRYLDTAKTKPTFLNFTKPFPEQNFTVVIQNDARGKFKGPPEEVFKNKNICVTGFITISRDRPQIVVTDPSQIEMQDASSTSTNQPPAAALPPTAGAATPSAP